MYSTTQAFVAVSLVAASTVTMAERPVDGGFGDRARPLTTEELASTTGGVLVTVLEPSPTTLHYVQNAKLSVSVANGQNQSTTWLYLYHGTNKTGYRTVSTPAPSYEGSLETRFMLHKGVKDLVIKYRDPSDGSEYVSAQVTEQLLHPDVKVYKLIVHNVTYNSGSTNVGRDVIVRAVDSQSYNQSLSVSDSMDAILAECPEDERIQWTLGGMDYGGSLHRINLHSDNCAALAGLSLDSNQNPIHNTTSEACLEELFLGSLEIDPNHEAYHIFVMDEMPGGLQGFNSAGAQGAIMAEAVFSDSPAWIATAMLHEIGHGFGLEHRSSSDRQCLIPSIVNNALMCAGTLAGKRLSAAECTAFYTTHTSWLKDLNE